MTAFANDVSRLIKSGTLFIRGNTSISFSGKKEYIKFQLDQAHFSMELLLIAHTKNVCPQQPIVKMMLNLSGAQLPETCFISTLTQFSEHQLNKAIDYLYLDCRSSLWENDLPIIFTKEVDYITRTRSSNDFRLDPEPCSWNDMHHLVFFQHALQFLQNPNPQDISRINEGKKVFEIVAKRFAGFITKAIQANQSAKSFVME